ncbi:MAG: helix-turn-helix transcriptional regulator [Oscillibacter sp.]|nr:helix-turn-helix transcriptional regulator [Oscillibacter sp.]
MNHKNLTILGQRLRVLRQEGGGTQRDMAAYLDCTVSNYQKIEYGQVNVPATTLVLLSQKFQVTTDYLLGLSDER